MTLHQLHQNFIHLLQKANKSGAFDLEDANLAIITLDNHAKVVNQQVAQTLGEQDPPPGNGLPHDPSKP